MPIGCPVSFFSKNATEFEDEQRRMKHRSEQHRAAASKLGGFEIINVVCSKQKKTEPYSGWRGFGFVLSFIMTLLFHLLRRRFPFAELLQPIVNASMLLTAWIFAPLSLP